MVIILDIEPELLLIAINNSADIDYNDFLMIYRDCANEPYFVFTIDTTQPVLKDLMNLYKKVILMHKSKFLIIKLGLRYKPDVVQEAKFEYSSLGQVFSKGLEKDEKQVDLLKRLKNIEDKIDKQLKENKGLQCFGYKFKERLSQDAKIEFDKIVDKER